MAVKRLWHNEDEHAIRLLEHSGTHAVLCLSHDPADASAITEITWHAPTQLLFFSCNDIRYKAKIITVSATPARMHVYLFNLNRVVTIHLAPTKKATKRVNTISSFSDSLCSPLAGRITTILVQPGRTVEKNEPLLIVESMKMENEIRSPAQAFVKTIPIKENDLVQSGQVLMTFNENKKGK